MSRHERYAGHSGPRRYLGITATRGAGSGSPVGGDVRDQHTVHWQVIGAILLTLIGIVLVLRGRDLVGMLIISLFFSLALIPLVERLHKRYGWKRGAAVGVIYVAGRCSSL